MTNSELLPMLLQFDYDLKFDETEIGGTGSWSYWSLVTDYISPAEILVRIDSRYGLSGEQSALLAKEVVKRWNAYDARTPSRDAAALEALKTVSGAVRDTITASDLLDARSQKFSKRLFDEYGERTQAIETIRNYIQGETE